MTGNFFEMGGTGQGGISSRGGRGMGIMGFLRGRTRNGDYEFLRGRTGEQGRAGISPRSEAFRWTEANLLPVTKLVTSGFLAKCLGQVDLLSAPLKHHSWDLCPPCPAPPGFDESSMFLS